ncbi:hypothetical protein Bca4012_020923 [Brassica carinata]|uniref:Uncharacterized protein n=1 Tax=Brassica carinata TaxID=52824 RepID=A0A8X7WHN9_BRACI|nr:hypothetical protein Bca52824_000702 [Brassica carinata]
MADGFGYGGFAGVPHPYWLCPPYQHPSVSTPPFLATHPSTSYDQTQGRFDPMIPHGSYHRSTSYGDDSLPPTPSSSLYAQTGNLGHGGEDSCKDTFPSLGVETSSDVVYSPPMERQRVPYSSATVSSLADMLIRNSQEPFYLPIPPSGVCVATSSAFDLNRPLPGHYYSGCGTHESVSTFVSAPSFGGSQTGIRLGDRRSFGDNVSSRSPEYIHSGASVEPVLVYGEATGHVKPLSKNPDLRDGTGSKSPRSSHPLQFDAKSSLYQKPTTLVADSGNGVSESSLKNAIGDLNFDEQHESWNQFMVSSQGLLAPAMFSMGSESCGAVKADNRNAAQPAVSYETHSEGSANQSSEDVQAKTCKLQEQFDKKSTLLTDLGIKGSSRSNADGVSTGQSPVCDQGDFASPASSTGVSSVVNALHGLSEVLVYECFSNRSLLKPEQLENLDKIVENLTKCLKKITGNKTIAGEEASLPTQAMHVSFPNVVDLNEAPNVVAKDCQGFSVEPVDSFGFKESVDKDKNEMTQSIKNILASNFPDGEENHHPQTLLYKNLWLETEAALCSTTCLARYHRIKNETGNLKLQNKEISADASTFMQEPFLNHQKSVSVVNKVEQETAEPLIEHGSSFGNNVVTMSHDGPQSSRFNSAPVDAVLSLMSRSFTGGLGQESNGNFKESHASITEEKYNDVIDRFQILKQQETMRKLKSQNSPDPDIDVIDRFQILEQQETMRKLKSQDCSETRMDDQEDNLEASEMATIGRSSHMSDVMGRFQLLKRREAEQVQKYLNSVDFDSDSDFNSDSDNDQTSSKTQMWDYLWSGSMMTTGGNSKIETCTGAEPSADGKGYESPTSDWEHVLKDN